MIKNCTNDEPDSVIRLTFYNSSGIIDNINILSQSHKINKIAFHIEYSSHVEVTMLTFCNNSIGLAYVESSTLIMSESTVESNHATTAVVFMENNSNLSVSNCTLRNNKSGKNGAAIAADHSVLEINECIFTRNQGVPQEKSDNCSCISRWSSRASVNNSNFNYNAGTVIVLEDSNISVANSNFSNNSALFTPVIYSLDVCWKCLTQCSKYNDGLVAAVALYKSTAILHHCKFIGNSQREVFVELSPNISITNSTFQDNFERGAITMLTNYNVLITNTTFLNNSATVLSHDKILQYQVWGSGGAILMSDSCGALIHCNFSYGQATSGGALSLFNSSLLIQDTMFENNVVKEAGGAIQGGLDVNVTIENSAFKNNTVQSKIYEQGGAINMINCLTVTIAGSLFEENRSPKGGAITAETIITTPSGQFKAPKNCTMTIYNSSFKYNQDSAINLHQNICLSINSSTFENNSSDGFGGAIYVADSLVNISNSKLPWKQSNARRFYFYSKKLKS